MDSIKWFELSETDKLQIASLFPHYAFYKKYRAYGLPQFYYEQSTRVKYHCTACETDVDTDDTNIHHDLEGVCEHCGANVTFKASGYGTNGLSYKYNVCVFRADGENLQVRCFKVTDYIDFNKTQCFNFTEKHRYYFSKDGAMRFGADGKQRKDTNKEPIFETGGYYSYNGYHLISSEEINRTFLKYSAWEQFYKSNFIRYLMLYIKHPNVEYLVKTGFDGIVNEYLVNTYRVRIQIDWGQNDVKKMIGLGREEFKYFSKVDTNSDKIRSYLLTSNTFQKLSTSDKIQLEEEIQAGKINPTQAERYKNKRTLSEIINAIHQENVHIAKRCQEIRNGMVFENEQFRIVVPTTYSEIKNEGDSLNHCVESYAKRHLNGTLHIVFIRTKEKPNVPFYTMEIDLFGQIVQVHGYSNKEPTEAVQAFVDEYRIYLKHLFKIKEEKTA